MKPAIHRRILVLAFVSFGAAACSTASGGTTGSSTSSSAGATSSGGGTTGTGTSGGTTGGATSGTTTGGTTTGGTSGGGTFSLSFPALTLHPGEEVTECVVVNLGNPATAHLSEIHNLLGAGAFSFVIYRSSDTQPQRTPIACRTWSYLGKDAPNAPLVLSHKADDDLLLPSGVGLTLQPNQMLRLELHALNSSATDLLVSASSVLTAMPDAQFQTEAAFLLFGDADVILPANATQTIQGFLVVPPSVVPPAAKFVQLDGHTHSLGIGISIATATSATSAETPVYSPTSWDWSNAPRVDTAPPFSLPPDGGLKIACDYNNTTPQSVVFGTAASNEICFFGAYVYPSNGAFVCFHTEEVPGGLDICCPGGGTPCDNPF